MKHGDEYVATNVAIKEARRIGDRVGERCRFYNVDFSSEPYLISIGDHVTLTPNVQFVTHDGGVWVFREKEPLIEFFGKISIGSNVFIGTGTIILLNTIIGDNCIIAAGTVLKGIYESNSIIGGVPGKVIGNISDYYEKNKHKFTYLKNLLPEQKRIEILKKLG